MKISKKGYTIADIPFIAVIFGVGIISLSIIASIVGDIRTTQCASDGYVWNTTTNNCQVNDAAGSTAGSYATNTSKVGLSGLLKISNWLPTIGLVLGAVIVITALSVLFTMRLRQ